MLSKRLFKSGMLFINIWPYFLISTDIPMCETFFHHEKPTSEKIIKLKVLLHRILVLSAFNALLKNLMPIFSYLLFIILTFTPTGMCKTMMLLLAAIILGMCFVQVGTIPTLIQLGPYSQI